MKKMRCNCLLLVFNILMGSIATCAAAASSPSFELKLGEPTFVLPRFSGPYREREASIAPSEFEMAENLRDLLEREDRDAVLAQLDEFFDIELSPAMLALKGQVYASLELYDEAEKIYLAVLKRMPELIRVHSDLAQIYLLREDYRRARLYFAKAVALGSNDALVHGQLAYLNLMLHGPFSAIDGYQRALAIEPDNGNWQKGLLTSLTQAKMYESALALLGEILAAHPESPDLWMNNAALAMQMGDLHQTAVSLEMALLLGEDDPQNVAAAAQLHLQIGQFDRAVELLGDNAAAGHLDMASLNNTVLWLVQKGLAAKAARLIEAVRPQLARVAADGQSEFYLSQAKLSEATERNFDAVSALYLQALEKNPVNGQALLGYADYLAEQGEYVPAELYYARAEAVDSVAREAMLGRAQMYIEHKDFAAALKQLRYVLQKYPELSDIKEKIRSLEGIVQSSQADDRA